MPMLGKKPFVREKPAKDLRLDEELFYCRTTHEVFREYERFFDRVILCNSLVWTCCVTGRNGLTYAEAIESETNARRTLKKFPLSLQRPLLYLSSLTRRSRINDLCDDVFNFVKDRYFVGETVEVNVNGIKKRCEVKRVIVPEKVERDSKSETKKTPVKNIGPDKIKYEVEEIEHKQKLVVKNQCISRPKTTYTKPQNKLFLKHHSEPDSGIWKLKEKSSKKYDLDNFNLSTVFPGPLPKYAIPTPVKKRSPKTDSSKKTVQGKLNFKKETEETKHKNVEKEQEEFVKHRMKLEEERQKRKEEQRKRIEDEKERLREQKVKEREQKKEEKRKHAEYMLSWKKPRDDLECDDLLDLPKPTPVDCSIPQDCFGDAVMILEFLDAFTDAINLKDSFRQGFTFENLEKALFETDIQGIFNDLLQLLLTAVFQLQDWEDEKLSESKKFKHIADFKDYKCSTLDDATDIATFSAAWPQLHHGTILGNMPLDSFSLTEVLRLHILASGSDTNRMAQLGLTGVNEDPGLYFKVEEPELMKKLSTASVFQLNCEERLKVLTLLTNQLASSSTLRNLVDENLTKSRPLKYELKSLRWAYVRQSKENSITNIKKKMEKSLDDSQKSEKSLNEKSPPEKNAVEKTEEEKENIDNMTPEEKAAFEEKLQKEEAKRKNEFLRKERDLIAQINKLQSSYQVLPIGRDRAYRRFWTFRSVSGIFVEDDDKTLGKCLSKETPQILPNPAIKKDNSVNTIRKYLQQLDSPKNGSSDKENDILQDLAIIQSDMPIPFKDRKLCDFNSRVDSKRGAEGDCSLCRDKMAEFEDNIPRYCPHEKYPSVFGLCTAIIETCPVHNIHAPRTKWSFFYKEEDLDSLLVALNIRGFREGPLREAILSEKETIKESMAKCQSASLNKHLPPPPQLERKSQRLQGTRKSEFANMKPREAMELTLRDMILEFEHRIYAGGLGSLKISDRASWRQAIEQSSYDMQCKDLHLGTDIVCLTNGIKEISSEERTVRDLACALLQLSQGIETKFLNPPLGETDHFKDKKDKALKNISIWEAKQKSKESDNEPDPGPCPKLPESALYRWQISLIESTSFSQLFVHLGTLERSVAWSRSVLKAHCRICRRRGDGENMLLCDGCNRGHHLYCLKPPLEEIPQGDWFCLSCKPPEKSTPQKKKVIEMSESESESEESEEAEEEESEEEDSNSEDNTEPVIEVCEECGVGGTVICCDGCPAVYHPECIGLRRIPRGEWLCPVCSKKEEAYKRSQKHSPTGSYSTRAQSLFNSQKKEKEKSRSVRTRIQIKKPNSKKEQTQDSSDSDWSSPRPVRRSNSRPEKRQRQDSSDSDSTPAPAKRSKPDTALNTARRRSKSIIGGENMLDYKTCYDLVLQLTRHPSSWPFLAPVNKKDAPNYHNVIKRPMDFGTIKSKLNNMKYRNNEDFVCDLFLVIQNCELFNPRSSLEYKAAREMHKEIKKLLDESSLSNYVPRRVQNNLMDNVFI